MYRIGICSDTKIVQSTMVDCLLKLSIELDLEFQVKVFSEASELMNYYRDENPNLHMILVDVTMGDQKCRELVKNIREVYDGEVYTLFLVDKLDFVLNNIAIQPFSYIAKPITYEALKKKIVEICKHIRNSENQYVFINSNGENVLLKFRDIVLIETVKDLSSKGQLGIETINGKYVAKGRLSDYAEKLKSNYFLHIHRSYLINLDYVNKFRNRSIVLKDGREFPIGRSKLKEVRQLCSKFVL